MVRKKQKNADSGREQVGGKSLMEDFSEFLRETDCIDFSNPLIVQKADELKAATSWKPERIHGAIDVLEDRLKMVGLTVKSVVKMDWSVPYDTDID